MLAIFKKEPKKTLMKESECYTINKMYKPLIKVFIRCLESMVVIDNLDVFIKSNHATKFTLKCLTLFFYHRLLFGYILIFKNVGCLQERTKRKH